MPADFKDWWQNSRSEWPAVAAGVIESQRADRDLGWEMAAKAAQAPAPAPSAARLTQDGKLHVTVWECHGCGHRGIDDGDDAAEACSDCNWRGPCPDEDVCPGCGREGTMVSACPKCGDLYYIKAEADIVIPTAAQAPAVKAEKLLRDALRDAQWCDKRTHVCEGPVLQHWKLEVYLPIPADSGMSATQALDCALGKSDVPVQGKEGA